MVRIGFWSFYSLFIGAIWYVNFERPLRSARNFIDGADSSSEALILSVLKKAEGDICGAAERIVEYCNTEGYNVCIAIKKLESLHAYLCSYEMKLRGTVSKLWLGWSINRFSRCIERIVEAREFVNEVIAVIRQSDIYKNQSESYRARKEREGRQKFEDKIRLIEARRKKIKVREGVSDIIFAR